MLALALPLLAAAAPAAQDPVAFDIQCVIATESAMEGAKPEMKGMLMNAITYFTGRVDAEIPSGELENRLVAQGKTLEGRQIGPLLQQCGEFMTTRGKAWDDIGTRLQAREKVAPHS